jgi:hypothetical protein
LTAGVDGAQVYGKELISYRVFVCGYGPGRVLSYTKASVGPSAHTVEFDDPSWGKVMVRLRRKGNGELPWMVMPGLLHRETISDSPTGTGVGGEGGTREGEDGPDTPGIGVEGSPAVSTGGASLTPAKLRLRLTPATPLTPATSASGGEAGDGGNGVVGSVHGHQNGGRDEEGASDSDESEDDYPSLADAGASAAARRPGGALQELLASPRRRLPELEAGQLRQLTTVQALQRGNSARKLLRRGLDQRRRIAEELLQTEERYVAGLTKVIEVFVAPLRTLAGTGAEVLSTTQVSCPFAGQLRPGVPVIALGALRRSRRYSRSWSRSVWSTARSYWRRCASVWVRGTGRRRRRSVTSSAQRSRRYSRCAACRAISPSLSSWLAEIRVVAYMRLRCWTAQCGPDTLADVHILHKQLRCGADVPGASAWAACVC